MKQNITLNYHKNRFILKHMPIRYQDKEAIKYPFKLLLNYIYKCRIQHLYTLFFQLYITIMTQIAGLQTHN